MFCVIIYAASNRQTAINNSQIGHQEVVIPKAKNSVEDVKVDSITDQSEQIIKAEV